MDKGNYEGVPYPCHLILGAVGLNKVVALQLEAECELM